MSGKGSRSSIVFRAHQGRANMQGNIAFDNPQIRGLSEDVAAVWLGTGVASLKSNPAPKIVEIEVDLSENFSQFSQFIDWFEEVMCGSPCATISKRVADVRVARPHSSPIVVSLEDVIPIGWHTSAFDVGQAPMLTLAFACDLIHFDQKPKSTEGTTDRRSVPVRAAPSMRWTQSLDVDGALIHVESCSGFKVSIECERVWDVDLARLVHTITPGRVVGPSRFIVKPGQKDESGRADAISLITEWYEEIAHGNGHSDPRKLTFKYSIDGGEERALEVVVPEAHITALEIRSPGPNEEPSLAFDISSERIEFAGTKDYKPLSFVMGESLQAFHIHPQFVDGNPDSQQDPTQYKVPALMLCPRYLVPSISRKMTRPDIKLGLSTLFHNLMRFRLGTATGDMAIASSPALVQPEYGEFHYSPNKEKNPQAINEIAFYVYASNPWPGHRMASSDLCMHLENILFPAFYAFDKFDTGELLENFDLDATGAPGAVGWREHRADDTQLPQFLFGSSGGKATSSEPCEQESTGIPIVISFKTGGAADKDAFGTAPITGLLTACSYSIDQWAPSGEPWRAIVTLVVQELRGLIV